MVKAKREKPAEAVKQIFRYIESTNESYREFLDENKDKYIDKEEKELEKITDIIRRNI